MTAIHAHTPQAKLKEIQMEKKVRIHTGKIDSSYQKNQGGSDQNFAEYSWTAGHVLKISLELFSLLRKIT